MGRLLLRLGGVLLSLWLLATFAFLLTSSLPDGTDPGSELSGSLRAARWREAARQETQAITGRQLPLFYFGTLSGRLIWHGRANQYHRWLTSFVGGDAGRSYRDGRPVWSVVGEALAVTIRTVGFGLLLALPSAVGLALLLVHGSFRRWHRPLRLGLYLLDVVPLFVLALAFLHGVSSWGGTVLPTTESSAARLLLPAVCLALTALPYLVRQTLAGLEENLELDFVRTARAKGLPESRVLGRHVLRPALLPLVTVVAGYLPALVGGVVVVEVIFSVPGTGRLLTDAVLARDLPVVNGLALALAAARLLAYLLADFLYRVVDPRLQP